MQTKHHSWKTLGPVSARLVTALYDRNQTLFSIQDAASLLGCSEATVRSLLAKMVQRGLVTRLRPGLFVIVPATLGSEGEYGGNPYLVARALVGEAPYFLSFASALAIHQMTTQPQFIVYTSTSTLIRSCEILGTEYRFVLDKQHLGLSTCWVDGSLVSVSDRERTILDGLRIPAYVGGVSEVARAISMQRAALCEETLVHYASMLSISAVTQRLGFLLELFRYSEETLTQLQSMIGSAYALLDPTLPREGRYLARWKLQLNIAPEELLQIGES